MIPGEGIEPCIGVGELVGFVPERQMRESEQGRDDPGGFCRNLTLIAIGFAGDAERLFGVGRQEQRLAALFVKPPHAAGVIFGSRPGHELIDGAFANQTLLPWAVQQDRCSLSAWIEAQAGLKPVSELDRLPSSKQVAFAERLARIKRRAVPDECFRDKVLMSKWIDGNR